ncbi:MAG: TlyA family RNA methyltransferase [Clostridia bacterium]
MKGTRADIRLVELGLAQSREKARSLIMAGVVSADGVRVDKPGDSITLLQTLHVKEDPNPFVSRGGLKLEKAISDHGICLDDAVALDIGASTGGFTDCMLKHGAKKVYSIDVGYGQLDWRLRNDERVVVMERTNARNMEPSWFNEAPNFASIDVSFISVRLILPCMLNCLTHNAGAVVLVKPQFEAGRGKVGKNGVVRDALVHLQVLETTALFAAKIGFIVTGMDFSPITGPKGNIEFLLMLAKNSDSIACDIPSAARAAVERAHTELE